MRRFAVLEAGVKTRLERIALQKPFEVSTARLHNRSMIPYGPIPDFVAHRLQAGSRGTPPRPGAAVGFRPDGVELNSPLAADAILELAIVCGWESRWLNSCWSARRWKAASSG